MSDHPGLTVARDAGVATVTIDHPPVNLLDGTLIGSLFTVAGELAGDDSVQVVVVRSANPEFFIAHADVSMIEQLPRDVREKPATPHGFHRMVDRFRTMPKATIGKIEGRARGGGSELLLSLDMRFGALGRAILSQPEVALGIIPGGSARFR